MTAARAIHPETPDNRVRTIVHVAVDHWDTRQAKIGLTTQGFNVGLRATIEDVLEALFLEDGGSLDAAESVGAVGDVGLVRVKAHVVSAQPSERYIDRAFEMAVFVFRWRANVEKYAGSIDLLVEVIVDAQDLHGFVCGNQDEEEHQQRNRHLFLRDLHGCRVSQNGLRTTRATAAAIDSSTPGAAKRHATLGFRRVPSPTRRRSAPA